MHKTNHIAAHNIFAANNWQKRLREYSLKDLPLLSFTALATSFCLPVALNIRSFANEDSERKKYFSQVQYFLNPCVKKVLRNIMC